MRLLAFSDWRSQNIDELINFVINLERKPDVILYGGDDVHRFGTIPKEVAIESALNNPELESEEYCLNISNDYEKFIIGFKNQKIDVYDKLREILEEINDWKKQYEKFYSGKKKLKSPFIRMNILGSNGNSGINSRANGIIDKITDILRLENDFEIEDIIKSSEIIQKGDINLIFISEKADNESNKFEELAKYTKYGLFGIIGNDCDVSMAG